MDKADLSQKMKQEAEKVQAIVSFATSIDDIFKYTVEITKNQGGKTIAAYGLDAEGIKELQVMCRENSIELLVPPFRENLSRIHTALTPADWGVAETGTLVLNSASEDLRIITMLSETHVAFLFKSTIRKDIDSLADTIDAIFKDSASYLAFITGASRTADIERVLSIGVHGPKELHIILREDES